ncbi:hypothetical protein LSTR_LSTR008726 [Laodelphax striatellus]|uniref:Uncharacterized protein n=1 Tax=Laodelphax striatellus TaxID=195883 RepID=A0A482XPV9_LAOST|nr:hypothetical protein LSTR_LSTR008726 [Laodelphax striatellus]
MSIKSNSTTPSRKSSSKLIREGSILLGRQPLGEINTDDYIAKMEEMNELLSNLEDKMDKVGEKLGEVDQILDKHEQKHNEMISFEKRIAKEKQAIKKLGEQHCELNI